MRNRVPPVIEPIFYIAQDETFARADIGKVPTMREAWDKAALLLEEHDEWKRIVFFGSDFTWINALSKPGFVRHEKDMLKPSEKDAFKRLSQQME